MSMSFTFKILFIVLLCKSLSCFEFQQIYSHTFNDIKLSNNSTIFYLTVGNNDIYQLPDFSYNSKKNWLYEKIVETNERINKLELYYHYSNDSNINYPVVSSTIYLPLSTPIFTINTDECHFLQTHHSTIDKLSNDAVKFKSTLSNSNNNLMYKCLNTMKPYNNNNNNVKIVFTIRLLNSQTIAFFYSSTLYIHQNKPVILPCWNPFSDYKATQVFWTFNILDKISYGDQFDKEPAHFNLHIDKFNKIESGLYQCFMYSQNNHVAVFSYVLQQASSNSDKERTKRNLKDTNKNTLQITLEEYPTSIKITWNKLPFEVNNYVIKWGRFYPGEKTQMVNGKEESYTITGLEPDMRYFLSIGGTTVNGPLVAVLRDTRTTNIIQQKDLPIPVNLKVIKVGNTWANITWTKAPNKEDQNPFGSSDISNTHYQVKYFLKNQQNDNSEKFVTSESNFVHLTQLIPDRKYEFCVRHCARDVKQKCGDWSFIEGFQTLGTVPFDAPQDLTLTPISGGLDSPNKYQQGIQVSWQPPKRPNGKITSYVILMTAEKEPDTSKWIERTMSGKNLNAVIDRVDKSRFYFFRIYCRNKYGRSPLSTIRVFKTISSNSGLGHPVPYPEKLQNISQIYDWIYTQYRNGNNKNSTRTGLDNSSGTDDSWITYKKWIIFGIIAFLCLTAFIIICVVIVNIKSRRRLEANLKRGEFDGDDAHLEFMRSKHQAPPVLTTPDLFRHTNEAHSYNTSTNPQKMYDNRTDSPNSFSSSKDGGGGAGGAYMKPSHHHHHHPHHLQYPPGISSGGHDPSFVATSSVGGMMMSPAVAANVVMTTSQITSNSNSNDPNFYPLSFLPHMGQNSMNIFTSVAPRVNAAASDFNSINYNTSMNSTPIVTTSSLVGMPGAVGMGGSQGTVLFEMSTPQSSGGKSSLSGSGSCNGFSKMPQFTNKQPITEDYSNSAFNDDQNSQDVKKAFSSEELSQEMENLEGLMKDLNQITEKEFEC